MIALLALCGWWGALVVLAAVVGRPSSLGLCGLCVSALKSFLGKVWFWVTCHVDCAWCKRRMHRAIWPRYRVGTVVTPAISHTICPACFVAARAVTYGPNERKEGKAELKAELIRMLMISKQLQ